MTTTQAGKISTGIPNRALPAGRNSGIAAGSPRHERPKTGSGAACRAVLTIRSRVREADAAAFVREALRDVRAYIEEHQLEVEGPPFSICRPTPSGDVDVEAGWPTRGAPGAGRIHSGELPTGLLRHAATRSWT
jgi:hypothetical protein